MNTKPPGREARCIRPDFPRSGTGKEPGRVREVSALIATVEGRARRQLGLRQGRTAQADRPFLRPPLLLPRYSSESCIISSVGYCLIQSS